MGPDQPVCSVVILNRDGKEFLQDCLSSVLSQHVPSFEVLVVDNGSTDGSQGFVRERFPSVRIIEARENLGYAAGNNLGVEKARGDLVVLLNNDTKVEEYWLAGLLEAVLPDDVAVASPLVFTEGYPARYYEKNGTINFLGQNIMRAFEESTDIFYAGGTSLIYKKKILGPPFDPEYFAYGEDVYLSLRARFLGYRIRHTNGSRLSHHGSGTAKRNPSRVRTYYQERNRLLNIVLFFGPWTLIRLIPLFSANICAKLAASILARRWSLAGLIQSYLWFFMNIGRILKKRKALKAEKRVPEKEIISVMSGKLTNGENTLEKLINGAALVYCRLVGLRTIELAKNEK